jgi:hypothetical protein
MAGRDVESDGGISEGSTVEGDAPVDWVIEASEQAKQGAFARTRRAEDDSPIGRKCTFHLKMEAAAARVE